MVFLTNCCLLLIFFCLMSGSLITAKREEKKYCESLFRQLLLGSFSSEVKHQAKVVWVFHNFTLQSNGTTNNHFGSESRQDTREETKNNTTTESIFITQLFYVHKHLFGFSVAKTGNRKSPDGQSIEFQMWLWFQTNHQTSDTYLTCRNGIPQNAKARKKGPKFFHLTRKFMIHH